MPCGALRHRNPDGQNGQKRTVAVQCKRVRASHSLLTIDQSEICQRKGKQSPCGNATSQQTTTSTDRLPLLGDHGAETEVKYVNRLGPRGKGELRREVPAAKKLCTHFCPPPPSVILVLQEHCGLQTFTIYLTTREESL